MKRKLILVCNSHIDPVWLWGWEEGLAETLSTFRTAVKFCEEYNDFVFCHNESLLYEWVEKFDPDLFSRIKKEVENGRWHIMGGWYLQPDCNLLLGESIVRQITTGKNYFLDKFNREPRTAVNFDSFGHSRGLVQLLNASGFDSYLFCRPDDKYLDLPDDTFYWIGFDGSKILAHRAPDHYNSQFGKAGERLTKWLNNSDNNKNEIGILLWGIGNHGGGPSETDLKEIRKIQNEDKYMEIIHGTPEEYFSEYTKSAPGIPEFKGNLNPFAVGCYTSMKTVKQALYKLEHKYFTSEKILSAGALVYGFSYPGDKFEEALREIMFCQFHDILPGTSVESVEKNVLDRIGHANRIIENETASFFIKAGNALRPAEADEFPLMLFNPHPFIVNEITEVELQLTEPNLGNSKKRVPFLFDESGNQVPVQSEKPSCNIKEDHRKKIVFRASILAGEIRRYSCYLKDISSEEVNSKRKKDFIFTSEHTKLIINNKTGFPKSWEFNGINLFGKRPFRFAVIDDNSDPWGMGIKSFDGKAEFFELMNRIEVSEFAGLKGRNLSPVYVSEYGEVRTIIESLFAYNNSRIHVRYFISAGHPEFDVEITVYWMEKDKLLKWIIPVGYDMNCVARSLCGINCFKNRNHELVFRDWLGMKTFDENDIFSVCTDGAYGFDINGNDVGISLLRSPSYSGHPVAGEEDIVMTDRAVKRIDQGVHTFRFRFIAGKKDELIDSSFNHSDKFNNPLICRIVYPGGLEQKKYQGIKISDDKINLQAAKLNSDKSMVIRLLNPYKEEKKFIVEIPFLSARAEVKINAKGIKTFIVKRDETEFQETDLLERNIRSCS